MRSFPLSHNAPTESFGTRSKSRMDTTTSPTSSLSSLLSLSSQCVLRRRRSSNGSSASSSLCSSIKEEAPLSSHVALGAGSFHGTELMIVGNFQERFPGSIKSASVGFMSPYKTGVVKSPTIEDVRKGTSGHVEVLKVELNDPEEHFESLIRFFFQMHDPTTLYRQGEDKGFRFASWIFYGDERQYKIASRVREEVQYMLSEGLIMHYEEAKVVTKMSPLNSFTAAPEEHQGYFKKMNPEDMQKHWIRFNIWSDVTVSDDVQSLSSANSVGSASLASCSSSIGCTSFSSAASLEYLEAKQWGECGLKRYRESQKRKRRYKSIFRSMGL